MNYAKIKPCDIANGVGVRVSLFVSGCRRHCKGCFNSETWDFNYGQPFTEQTVQQILDYLKRDYIKGFSLLGGEPFEPENQHTLAMLLEKIKQHYPDKTIWCYTGFNLESDLLTGKVGNWDDVNRMLNCIDILTDGDFRQSLSSPNLRFRGSANQRIIDLQPTLHSDNIVLWEGDLENQL